MYIYISIYVYVYIYIYIGTDVDVDMERTRQKEPFLSVNSFLRQVANTATPSSVDLDTRLSSVVQATHWTADMWCYAPVPSP